MVDLGIGAQAADDGSAARALPRILVATDGREPLEPPGDDGLGILLRDLDLATLVSVAATARPLLAVDLDSVEGLNADPAAVSFLVRRLGIGIVMTRRQQLAARVAELGGLGLVHVFAFDSTGLTRSLEGYPASERVGTVISPGPVLGHLSAADRARLPRPIVAYGLIDTAEQALAQLEYADAVVLRPACAASLRAAGAIAKPPVAVIRAAPARTGTQAGGAAEGDKRQWDASDAPPSR